jgi:hypothetical protein
MPFPPQENAPSLSPGQSFGYQSPFPWVIGTDWTRSLWALWQLQGSFQEFSPFLYALSHLEGVAHRSNNLFLQLQPPLSPGESVLQTGQQATRSPVLCDHNNPRENRRRLSQTGSAITGWSHSHSFETGNPRTGSICQIKDASAFRIWHRLSPNQHCGSWFKGCTIFSRTNIDSSRN